MSKEKSSPNHLKLLNPRSFGVLRWGKHCLSIFGRSSLTLPRPRHVPCSWEVVSSTVVGFVPIWPRWFVKFVALVGTFHDTFLIVFAFLSIWNSFLRAEMVYVSSGAQNPSVPNFNLKFGPPSEFPLVKMSYNSYPQGVMGSVTKWIFSW